MIVLNNKQAAQDWEKYRQSLKSSSPVDLTETPEQKSTRIHELEADPQKWKEYYFKKFFKYPSPKFHLNASSRLINSFLKFRHWYEVRHWARGLSKSTTTMMDILYLVYTCKLKNVIQVSSTYDAAEAFLEKYRAHLDSNPRLLNDYGKQEVPGSWAAGLFRTRNGVQFIALGKGQSPRGNGNEEVRPDCILVDDFDTDQDCRNPEIIDKDWAWYEKALFFTVDTSEPYLIIWLGNIIAPDCCVVRAGKKADYTETINIRDENGNSTWPEKNSEEDIQYQIDKVSYAASQQELFNNPVREGSVFKSMAYKPARPIKEYSMLVCYTDPSFKDSKKNDYKATVLVGKWKDEYHVLKCFLQQTTTAKMIDWHYSMRDFAPNRSIYYYMEQVFLQEILLKEFYAAASSGRKAAIPIVGDQRKKDDKFTRIESLLEPLNRNGKLFLNEDEKHTSDMQKLEEQFLAIGPGSRAHDDGPDAVEGAVWMINKKQSSLGGDSFRNGSRPVNDKRY